MLFIAPETQFPIYRIDMLRKTLIETVLSNDQRCTPAVYRFGADRMSNPGTAAQWRLGLLSWRKAPAWLGGYRSQVMLAEVSGLADEQPLFNPKLRAPTRIFLSHVR